MGWAWALRSGGGGLSPTEKLKESGLQAPKPVQHPLHPVPATHHAVPGLLSNHSIFSLPGSSAATALLIQRTNEEEKWLARQRRLRQEKEDRQSQVSEFRQQVLEQHLDMGRAPVPAEAEHRPDSARWGSAGGGLGGMGSEPAGVDGAPAVCPPPECYHLLPRALPLSGEAHGGARPSVMAPARARAFPHSLAASPQGQLRRLEGARERGFEPYTRSRCGPRLLSRNVSLIRGDYV